MRKLGVFLLLAVIAIGIWQRVPSKLVPWTDNEVTVLKSLWIESLPELAADPSNAVADNPVAANFGRALFFDTRLSVNGGISCATCHQEERRFTDGLQKAQAIGSADRNTPSIVGAAYSPWQYWDGRRDSQWAQALAPLEDPDEHGTTREQVVALVLDDAEYRPLYDALFAEDELDVNVVFANIGKSIAAFERSIMPTAARFDAYVEAVSNADIAGAQDLFSDDEVRGLRLFIGEANCTQCHNGPLFTNHEFHNTGVISFPGEVPDKGRISGVQEVLASEFNCTSPYSNDVTRSCPELKFARTGIELMGTFKTPSLRNLENTAPYMHKGQLATLQDVLQHYNDAPDAMIGHNEAKPLNLSERELEQLEAFLNTLAAPLTEAHVGGTDSSAEIETTSSL
jgi:cytochrome c peroxidase